MLLKDGGIVVSRAPLKYIILAKAKILLKIIAAEKKSNIWRLCKLYLMIPIPKPDEIIEVANTNINTSAGFVDFPQKKLSIKATKVTEPMIISITPINIIPNLFFIFHIYGSPNGI
jgi:hypothetical protein